MAGGIRQPTGDRYQKHYLRGDIVSEQPDQPPRKTFGQNAQEFRRELADVLRHHEIYARNALEILQRPNCTVALMKQIIDRTAEYVQVIGSCQIVIDQWLSEPLSEIGLDMPLGRMPETPQTGERPNG
jgi:hypothetical protein